MLKSYLLPTRLIVDVYDGTQKFVIWILTGGWIGVVVMEAGNHTYAMLAY